MTENLNYAYNSGYGDARHGRGYKAATWAGEAKTQYEAGYLASENENLPHAYVKLDGTHIGTVHPGSREPLDFDPGDAEHQTRFNAWLIELEATCLPKELPSTLTLDGIEYELESYKPADIL